MNPFRAAWLYHRLPAGDALLAAGKGLSPAFLQLLGAVNPGQSVSFAALQEEFPHLDADDLELWLAELCRMQLITPAASAAGSQAAPIIVHAPAVPTQHPVAPRPRLLLVHKLPSTRLAWCDLLAALPVELHQAGTLEEASSAFNRLNPQAVILGPEGGDFNALNLVHLLKHPRVPLPTRVFLMLDERHAGARTKAAAACADDTVLAKDWPSLAGRVARQLGMAEPAAPATDLSVTQKLLYGNADANQTLGPTLSALENDHPRIAAILADNWGQASLDDLFDQLIFDDRGDRAGFAVSTMEDLLLLYRVHRELRPLEEHWQVETRPRNRRASTPAMRKTGRHGAYAGAGRAV